MLRARHRQEGGAGAGAAATGGGEKKGQQPAKKKPLAAVFDAGFGNWEKHTKGIGKKLLMKMGFKGGLGKNEDGVTRQLEVKLRPMQSGLEFGSFREAATLMVNREIEAHRQGKTLEQMEAEVRLAAASGRGTGTGAATSRKNASGKKRKRRIILEELGEQQDEEAAENEQVAAPPKQTIMDMRGPQTKLVYGMDDLAPMPSGASEDGGIPKLGQELLHNVGLLAGLPETEVQELHGRRLAAVDRAKALEKVAAVLRTKVDASAERLSRLEKVETILHRVHDKVGNNPASVMADDVLKAFRTLREIFPEEYAVFGLARLILALIVPVVKVYPSPAGARCSRQRSRHASWPPARTSVLTPLHGLEMGTGGQDAGIRPRSSS